MNHIEWVSTNLDIRLRPSHFELQSELVHFVVQTRMIHLNLRYGLTHLDLRLGPIHFDVYFGLACLNLWLESVLVDNRSGMNHLNAQLGPTITTFNVGLSISSLYLRWLVSSRSVLTISPNQYVSTFGTTWPVLTIGLGLLKLRFGSSRHDLHPKPTCLDLRLGLVYFSFGSGNPTLAFNLS